MPREIDASPDSFSKRLLAAGSRRAWIVRDPQTDTLHSSHSWLAELVAVVESQALGSRKHEGVFFEVGPQSGALYAAFVHRAERGQAQGGCRHWNYQSVESFLLDGLRLSGGMGRKCALAGLWWGGGKALIAVPQGTDVNDPAYRLRVFSDFGRFITSLRGCYVTAEDAGSTPLDLAEVYRHTRFVTCSPPQVGGSGNPSPMTAAGVLRAMEAGLDFIGGAPLPQCAIAMQGAGNVGGEMIERLLALGVPKIVVSEISDDRCSLLHDRFAGRRVEVRRCQPEDTSILAEDCDVLVPNALGGVLDSKTIPEIRARLVCGAANNPLLDDQRDATLLEDRGITFVPDFVANRMGIVACGNEQYGSMSDDASIERHFDGKSGWHGSVYNVTLRVLERARSERTTSVAAANQLADERATEVHPIWGDRAQRILQSLVKNRWEAGGQ